MRTSWHMAAAVVALAALGILAWVRGRHGGPPPAASVVVVSPRVVAPVASSSGAPLGLDNLVVSTDSASVERVKRAFPHGVATEDARAEIGTAPPPPSSETLDVTTSFVAEIALSAPVSAGRVRDGFPESNDEETHHRWVKGRVAGTARWLHVADEEATTSFDRVAVLLDLIDADKPVTSMEITRTAAWARALSKRLGGSTPEFPMRPAAAEAKARDALALREKYTDDDRDVGVVVHASKGKPFAAKTFWDVMYSAGFTWGDGDYFHWVPSPETDNSQGIGVGTSKEPGYFFPEWVAAGTGDVDDLEMSFDVGRTWHPTQVCDVMSRTAAYAARRLGGTLTTPSGTPFDAQAARERVAAIESAMNARGIPPELNLALTVF